MAGLALGSWGTESAAQGASLRGARALHSTSLSTLRQPGSLPDPKRAAGSDLVPEIENIVVVMMENHSFDNMLGMLGRGDGFPLDARGTPKAACPDGKGKS